MRKVINFFVVFSFIFLAASANVFAQATFSSKTDFPTGISPTASTVCDLNNDGKKDIAVINSGSATCSFYMNTTSPGASTPSFSIPTALTTGLSPQFVTNADMNGDGKKDLLITLGAGTLSIYLNTTVAGAVSPTFSAADDFAAGALPYSAAVADFNYDGVPDVAVANASGNTLSVFLNYTVAGAVDAILSSPLNVPMVSFPYSVTTADFNGDGKQDIACSRGIGGATPISILLNTTVWGDPLPSFTVTEIASDLSPAGISSGDINSDGKPDLVMGNEGANIISVLMNTTTTGAATPTFGSVVNFPAGSTPASVKIVDLNCDGMPDVLLTNFTLSSIGVYLNTTIPGSLTPDFAPRSDFLSGASPVHITPGEFNGDYRVDMVSTNYADTTISVFLNTMTLGTMPPEFSLKTDFAVPDISSAILNDMNGDGIPDVTTVNTNSNTISVLMNSTSPGATIPGFSAATNFAADTLPKDICASDINTDGKQDIIVANESNSVSFFINITTPGSTTAAFTSRTDMGTAGLSAVAAGDFNLDGQPDIVVTNIDDDRIELLMNKLIPGDTVVTFLDTVSFSTGSVPVSVSVADVNNDGRPDIIVGNGAVASVSVFINITEPGSTFPNFTVKTDFVTGGGVYTVSTADFNGDGKLDLYTANNFTNTHSVLFNSTVISDTVPVFTMTNYITGAVRGAVGDFNGDGKPDIAGTIRLSDLAFVRVNLTNPGASSPSFSGRTNSGTGTTPQSIAAGDINSDGKTEYLVSNPLDNTFSVLLNTADYPLPVELASFSASVSGNSVSLYWSTVSEENNSGFDIERKLSEDVWKKAGFVNGAGTTNQPRNYSFTESGLHSGRYSYRLKQIDYNGNYKYHEIRNEVLVGVPGKFALMQNYPNPFNPSTIINYQLAINSFVTLKIYDISGREVMQLVNEVQQAGYYAVNFNAKNLSSGAYFYKLSTDKFSDVKKMVVVK